MKLKRKGTVTVVFCDMKGQVKDPNGIKILKHFNINAKELCKGYGIGTIKRPVEEIYLVVYKRKIPYPLQQVMDVFEMIKAQCIADEVKEVFIPVLSIEQDGTPADMIYMTAHKCFAEEPRLKVVM